MSPHRYDVRAEAVIRTVAAEAAVRHILRRARAAFEEYSIAIDSISVTANRGGAGESTIKVLMWCITEDSDEARVQDASRDALVAALWSRPRTGILNDLGDLVVRDFDHDRLR